LNLDDKGGFGLEVHWPHQLQQPFLETLFHTSEYSSVPAIKDQYHGMGLHIQSVDDFTYGSHSGEGVTINL
jgi:hypothetical protein